MITPKRVFLDSSWLAYRAKYTLGGSLSYHGQATGIIFGMLNQIKAVCNDPYIRSNRVACCFDSRKSVRRDSFPEYKEKRRMNRTQEETDDKAILDDQLQTFRRFVCPAIGIPTILQTGMESDDVMAQALIQCREDDAVLITADNDLWQCITQKAHWYDPVHKLYLDYGGMINHKIVGPNDWVDVKSIAGCDTDNVPGVPGVGEKTAINFLWKLIPKNNKRYRAIMASSAIIERNRGLVKLPHDKCKQVELDEPRWNWKGFSEVCSAYGFKSFLKDEDSWKRLFDGEFSKQSLARDRRPSGQGQLFPGQLPTYARSKAKA